MAKASMIYVICHSWPRQDGYSVMPQCYRKRKDAAKAAAYYARLDDGVVLESETQVAGTKHGYAVKAIELT